MPAFGGTTVGTRLAPSASDDWLSPPEILQALGPFDLDPCASVGQPWRTAETQWTYSDMGLAREWHDLVWLNPPYSKPGAWVEALAAHPGGGIALVFARTETQWFQQHIFERADRLLFLAGRLKFCRPRTGEPAELNAPAPSVLVAYGPTAGSRLSRSGLVGAHVQLTDPTRGHV